jgi:hypothetical protein
LLSLLAHGAPPTLNWQRMAELVSQLLRADFCCVVLRDRGDKDRLCVSAYGNSGPLSIAARRELIRSGSVIRGLLAPTPAGAEHEAACAGRTARRGRETAQTRQALYEPIVVDDAVAGVVHVRRDGPQAHAFSDQQVACARLVALLIGNALHLGRLKGLLQSNFGQFAVLRGAANESGAGSTLADPHGLALRIARLFYRELKNARFENNHIIGAAAEIIAELSLDLRGRAA